MTYAECVAHERASSTKHEWVNAPSGRAQGSRRGALPIGISTPPDHTAAPLKAVAPVLVSREEIEPSWSREEELANLGVTARPRVVTDAPHHTRVTAGSARLPPGTDPVVLMFASDKRYRHSKLVLARCSLGELDPRGANPNAAIVGTSAIDPATAPPSRRFQYLQWVDYSGGPPGVPFWTEGESLAMPLVDHETFGQPHVVREPRTGLWLMTDEGGYAGKPGIALRWAPTPWGPWGNTTAVNPYTGTKERFVVDQEPALILFEGDRDHGPGNFLHRKLVYAAATAMTKWPNGSPRVQQIDPCLSVAPASPRNQRLYVREELGTVEPWPSSRVRMGPIDAPHTDQG